MASISIQWLVLLLVMPARCRSELYAPCRLQACMPRLVAISAAPSGEHPPCAGAWAMRWALRTRAWLCSGCSWPSRYVPFLVVRVGLTGSAEQSQGPEWGRLSLAAGVRHLVLRARHLGSAARLAMVSSACLAWRCSKAAMPGLAVGLTWLDALLSRMPHPLTHNTDRIYVVVFGVAPPATSAASFIHLLLPAGRAGAYCAAGPSRHMACATDSAALHVRKLSTTI